MRVFIALAALLFALVSPVQAQAPASLGEPLRVSLITFAPGETYWQRFGHNALLVENTATGANAVYNYGMFDFFQKNFFLNFAKGKMLYHLDVESLDRTLQAYRAEHRWVYQQVLDLNAEQRLQIAVFLDRNAQPDRAEYYYDYFRDNCSTRVRDAIDQTIGGALKARLMAEPVPTSYRSEGTRLIRPITALAIGMDAIMGPAGDAPMTRWQQSFVPEVLMQAVAQQQVGGKPLVLEARYLVSDPSSPVTPAAPLRWTCTALLLGFGLAALLVLGTISKGRFARIGFPVLAVPLLLLAGLGGLFMLAAWTLTAHWSMAANENLLLFSPLALLLIPLACCGVTHPVLVVRRDRRATFWRLLIWVMLAGALLSAVLPFQQQAPWLALWLPIHGALAFGLLRRI